MNGIEEQPHVSFDLHIATKQVSNDNWAAFEPRLGVLVFADTEEKAIRRVYASVDDILEGIKEFHGENYIRNYLERHNVEFTLVNPQWMIGNVVESQEAIPVA